MGRIRQVRRDNGTLEPFRERKVAEAIMQALKAAGTADRPLAEELAGVVVLFLEKYHGLEVPSVADVEEMLCRVLKETGHPQAARRFEELQRERRRLEEEVTVRYLPGKEAGAAPSPTVEEVRPWNRGRLVRSLVRAAELPASLAEEIAAAVEARLISSALRSVTPVLIRELVAYEFVDRGLEAPIADDDVYGVTREALDRLVSGQENQPLDRMIAGAALRRWALGGIHGDVVATAHAEGSLHVHGLDDPLKVERLVLPASLLIDDIEATAGDLLLGVRTTLDGLRDHVRQEILLPDVVGALCRHSLAGSDPSRLCDLLLRALDFRDAYGEVTSPRPHLVVPLGTTEKVGAPFLAALLARLHESPEQGDWLPVSLAYGREMELPGAEALEKTFVLAAARPGTVLQIVRERDVPLFPAADGSAPVPLTVSLGRLAINLPLALMDARGCGLKEVLSDLDAPCRAAMTAFHERYWHQRGGARQGLHGVVVRLGGPARVQVHAQGQEVDLEVWGLAQALEMLVQREVVHPAQRPQAAARLLGYLDYLISEEQGGVKFRVRLGGVIDRDVRRRLLEALENHVDRYGVVDVQDMLRDESLSDRATLPVVLPLPSDRNAALLYAPFAERTGPGLALPLAAFGDDDPASLLRRLDDDTRVGLLTLSPRRPGEDVFEVQEELFA